jgi:hypothetical protein
MHMHAFRLVGFNGDIGSSDAIHIAIEQCTLRLTNNHLDAKRTTTTFNPVNNHRHIVSTTVGLFDSFVQAIYEGLSFSFLFL